MKTHLDLNVWKSSTALAIEVYHLTKSFPREEMYGITSQIRRAAISIPSNISEGASRNSKTEFVRFLNIAGGSLAELETQLYLSTEIGFIEVEQFKSLCNKLNVIRAQICGLKKYLLDKKPNNK
jgi:four helix bundle protein